MDLEAADSTRALVNVPIIVTFFSSHISGLAPYSQVGLLGVIDIAKWVDVESSTCNEDLIITTESETESKYRITASEQNVIRDAARILGRATFEEFLSKDNSFLFYKFANEPINILLFMLL